MAEDTGREVHRVFTLIRFGTSAFDFTCRQLLISTEVFIF